MKVTIEFDGPDEAMEALSAWKVKERVRKILDAISNRIGSLNDPATGPAVTETGYLLSLECLIDDSFKDFL